MNQSDHTVKHHIATALTCPLSLRLPERKLL